MNLPDKTALRRSQRFALHHSCLEDATAMAASLRAHLGSWLLSQPAAPVLCYSPLADEPDIRPLLPSLRDAGFSIALPKVNPNLTSLDLFHWPEHADPVPGAFGILEPDSATWQPIAHSEISIVLIPGLAFDPITGVRLGRGAGFYDRLLAHPDFHAIPVGIALPPHLLANLPSEVHDIPMRFVATTNGVLSINAEPAS